MVLAPALCAIVVPIRQKDYRLWLWVPEPPRKDSSDEASVCCHTYLARCSGPAPKSYHGELLAKACPWSCTKAQWPCKAQHRRK